MATCGTCNQEMRTAASCTCVEIEYADGVTLPRLRWGEDRQERCGDCAVQPGGFHHLGCDQEVCPRCKVQLLACRCSDGDGRPGISDEPERNELQESFSPANLRTLHRLLDAANDIDRELAELLAPECADGPCFFCQTIWESRGHAEKLAERLRGAIVGESDFQVHPENREGHIHHSDGDAAAGR